MRRHGGLKLGAETSLYVLTAAGLATAAATAAATYGSSDSGNTINFPPSFLNGVVRSSRALFTVTICSTSFSISPVYYYFFPFNSAKSLNFSDRYLRGRLQVFIARFTS